MNLQAATRLLSRKQIRSIGESASARISVWTGAVRSGKTIASLLAFLIAVATAPDQGLIFICGKTLQTIERNVIGPLQDTALFGTVARDVHHTRGATTATILGRTVHLIGASNALAEDKIRGATVYLAYVDEATLVPEAFWTQLLARLSVPGARLLATTNPDGPMHWLRQKFLLRVGELNLRYWHFTLDDNPSLDPAYVASLKKEYVGLWYRRFIKGEWCLAEGSIYDMWDEARHVVPEVPHIERWISTGIDYGMGNPFHAVRFGIAGGVIYGTSEYRYNPRMQLQQMTDATYADALIKWWGDERPPWTVVDPSATSFINELQVTRKIPTIGAVNDVVDGIRLVAKLLALDLLKFHVSCKGLREEFPGYSWDPKAAEKGIDQPIKAGDHGLDASRYGIVTTEAIWTPHVYPRGGRAHADAY
jgi:PBSX family phage terminase large subunit